MAKRKRLAIFLAVFNFTLASLSVTSPLFAVGKEKVLYNFKDNGKDGHQPNSPLISDMSGNLYGTTYAGGTGSQYGRGNGCGTVFELSPGVRAGGPNRPVPPVITLLSMRHRSLTNPSRISENRGGSSERIPRPRCLFRSEPHG
jgi:hypothetical protein